ncbi:MAG TPA: hypothetical protein PJ994_00350, partial [Tepidiformaceae bacterium]|nr:hypothetical protein [Tepidiformaceae bacterium]
RGDAVLVRIVDEPVVEDARGGDEAGLVNDSNKDSITPVEHMAEACLHLVHGDPKTNTGAITYASDVLKQFNLTAAELLA